MTEVNESEKGALAILAVIADPKASAARLAELQRVGADIAKAKTELENERAAFNAEIDATRAEIAEERRRAAGMWKAAQEKKFEADARMERAEEYAKKVGYWEKPTSVAIGTSGMSMTVFDEPPESPATAAPAPDYRQSREGFGAGSTITRAVEEPARQRGAQTARRV